MRQRLSPPTILFSGTVSNDSVRGEACNDSILGNGGAQSGSPAAVVGSRSMTPGVCPKHTDWAKKSLKLPMLTGRQHKKHARETK